MTNAMFAIPQNINNGYSGWMGKNLEELRLNFQRGRFCGFVNHIHNIEYDSTLHCPDVKDNHE